MTTAPVTPITPATAPDVEIPPALLAKLAEPGVADALTSLLSHADLVAILVEGLDGLVGRSEEIGDSLVDGIAELQSTVGATNILGGLDVGAVGRSLVSIAGASPTVADLLTSGLLDDVQPLLRGVTRGNEMYAARSVEIGGAFSLLKLLKDPDIHRTVTYLATLAKAIGQELAAPPTTPVTTPVSTPAATSTTSAR